MELPLTRRDVAAHELDAVIAAAARLPFALDLAPLLRVEILRLAPTEHVLLLAIHHIVSDGWSMGVLVQEFAALYAAYHAGRTSPLAELPLHYVDYAAWQRDWLLGGELERQLGYWRERLRGAPALLELPTDRPRPATQTYVGRTLRFVLDPALAAAAQAQARSHGASLFMLLLAAFKLLLARWSGQADISVGTPVANRERVELEPLIGFFVNNLVLRDRVDAEESFAQFLMRLARDTLTAFRHQAVSFEQLVEDLKPERSLSHAPLFQIMFALQNAPLTALELPGLSVALLSQDHGASKYDLSFELEESPDGLLGSVEYNTDLFDAATVERFVAHYRRLLTAVLAMPDRAVGRIDYLAADEREQLLVGWNATATAYPQDRWIHAIFEAQVSATPDAPALRYEEQMLSYAELNRRANRLAHRLRERGVGPDSIVGVCAYRSIGTDRRALRRAQGGRRLFADRSGLSGRSAALPCGQCRTAPGIGSGGVG